MTRARLFPLTSVLALSIALPAWGEGLQFCPRTGASACRSGTAACQELIRYLEHHAPEGTPVLAFDHLEETWLAAFWEDHDLGELAFGRRAVFDVNCKPSLRLARGQDVFVVVFNTNPMLFQVDTRPVEEADVEAIESLQQLATLLGGVVRAGVVADRQVFDALGESAEEVDTKLITATTKSGRERLGETRAFLELIKRLTRQANLQIRTTNRQLEPLQKGSGKLLALLRTTESRRALVRSYLRAIELGQAPGVTLASLSDLDSLDRSLDDATAGLAQEVGKIKAPACTTGYSAASAALALLLKRHREAKDEDPFLEATASLRQANLLGDDDCSAREIADLGELAGRLEAARSSPWTQPVTLPDGLDAHLQRLGRLFTEYSSLAGRLAEVEKIVPDLLSKAPAAAKLAQGLRALRQREATYFGGGTVDATRLPVGVLLVHGGRADLRPFKQQKRPFEIEVDAPLAADIDPRHKPFTGDDKLEVGFKPSLFDDIDVGVGLVYAEIADPEFKAVDNPLDPEDAADEDKTKVIARTAEDSRRGDLALFASYTFLGRQRFTRLGAEIGARLDTDDPGVFAGLALKLGKLVRVSAGWTWQEVAELVPGQRELRFVDGEPDPASITVVSDNDSIRTRETFADDWYVSLSIILNELPFFAAEED